ncbi:glycosyltransferase [Atlantibacter sp.]|uniref:glycosyltransferase n=1 Tax=Atlantibacter sp. TaxID=1903473 RepID=UPI00289F55C6|nr:glycosyltransferase [Atlantibacter sp.]
MSQRPHYFIQHALHAGVSEVLWINPYPGRLPNFQDFVPGRHAKEPTGRLVLKNLYVESVQPIVPLEPFHKLFKLVNSKSLNNIIKKIIDFKDEKTIIVVGKPSLLAMELCLNFSWRRIVFDAMDNYPAFFSGYSSKSMKKLEQKIADFADNIICTSHPLESKFANYATKVQRCLNACTPSFLQKRNSIKQLDDDSITFGYVGTIASWFDWEWVITLANLHPNHKIRLVGPLKTLKPRGLPSNIIFDKPISHDDVPAFLSEIDVGLIPFLDNEITHYVDPIKYYEYRSSELPILSTKFGEMTWHHNDSENSTTACPFILPTNSLYFGPSNFQHVTWDMRFAELFKTIIMK